MQWCGGLCRAARASSRDTTVREGCEIERGCDTRCEIAQNGEAGTAYLCVHMKEHYNIDKEIVDLVLDWTRKLTCDCIGTHESYDSKCERFFDKLVCATCRGELRETRSKFFHEFACEDCKVL